MKHVARQHRSGLVTVAVIVVLAVTTALCLQLARQALLMHQSVRQQEYRLQCESLVSAGLLRAEKAIANDETYTGETWLIEAKEIHQTNSAQVTITVSDGEINCEARYPANADLPCTMTETKRGTR